MAAPLLLARPAGRRGTVVLTGYADEGADVGRHAGRTVPVGELARGYGIIDVDGTRPGQ